MPDEKEVLDEGKNCPSCKKVMRRAKRYYRNGGYYCNKNCFKKFQEQSATKAAK